MSNFIQEIKNHNINKALSLEMVFGTSDEDFNKSIDVVADTLNKSFLDGLVDEQAVEIDFKNLDTILEKARPHKYYKREGSPGNYKYYYTKEQYEKKKGSGGGEEEGKEKVVSSFSDTRERGTGYVYDIFSDGSIVSSGNLRHNKKFSDPEEAKEYLRKQGFEESQRKTVENKPVGSTHEHNGKKYKKQSNGKWVEVSEQGMTKKEHYDKVQYFSERLDAMRVGYNSKEGKIHQKNLKDNYEQYKKLSNKEHSDEEVGLGKNTKGLL